MSVHYVRDLTDISSAMEAIVDDIVEKETGNLLSQLRDLESEVQELEALQSQVSELEERVIELESENESLLEYKRMYEELCK